MLDHKIQRFWGIYMKNLYKIWAPVFAFGLLIPGLVQASCDTQYTAKSPVSHTPASLTFSVQGALQEENSYKIYWIDLNGQRQYFGTLWGSESLRIDTAANHIWIVTMPVPGSRNETCYAMYSASPGASGVTIKQWLVVPCRIWVIPETVKGTWKGLLACAENWSDLSWLLGPPPQ